MKAAGRYTWTATPLCSTKATELAPITVSAEVNRSAEDVFAYATDPSCFAKWQQGVISGHMEGGDSLGVGDRCVMVRRIGCTNRTSTSELVRVDPPRTWRVAGIDGPIRATVDVEVAGLDDQRARVTIAVDFAGQGIGRLLIPLAA